jgi:arabinofuranan 3-O-arabinosyltransferase
MQEREDRLAADARLLPFNSRAGFYAAGLTATVSLGFLALILAVAFILTAQPDILAMSVDFRVFWAAGKLAVAGDPLAVHDITKLSAAHATYVEAYMPWLYPPGYLVLVTPFGTLSFAMAFLVWTLLSLAITVWAVQPFVAGIRPLWVLMVLAPAYYPTLLLGQNSLFWMAGLLGALAALRDGRWALAGVFIGALTLKPQLGVMIPFALLAIGAWRTILAAILTTIALIVLPTLYYGLDYWPLLRTTLEEHSANMIFSVGQLKLMLSPLYFLTFVGLDPDLALNVQWVIAGAAAVAVFLLWRSDRVGFDAKAAGLLCAILLSAPYLWYYEGALLAVIALFLLRAGVLTFRPLHLLLLVPLWIGGGLQALNTFTEYVDQRWLGAAYISPLVLICLGLCLWPALQPRRAAADAA